ncbi:cutinase family protein [Corynebacterium canis]|uniref:Cutinase family protein n=1 Tax=Corynebacterium canis TaxID=679663 RepID=A0A5C5UI84_9CORY|nr:cutinase family protein [Corynebacterium canis]WJY74102.1 Cutinase [Corynebacterium canis]
MQKPTRTAIATITGTLFSVVGIPVAHADEAQECPEVEIVVARGTTEGDIGPQRYGSTVSNGFEGEVLARLFRFLEQRHGEALFDDVAITGIADTAYRAEPVLPDEVVEPDDMDERVENAWDLIVRYGPIPMIIEPAIEFVRSVFDGVNTIPTAMENQDQETGCSSQTILVGYSQGAMVLQSYEKQLADQGRLVGALMIGDPQLKMGQANAGQPQHSGGLFGGSALAPQQVAPRYEYCKRNDFVCDTSAEVIPGIDVHLSYFDPETVRDADEKATADMLAQWVEGAKS